MSETQEYMGPIRAGDWFEWAGSNTGNARNKKFVWDVSGSVVELRSYPDRETEPVNIDFVEEATVRTRNHTPNPKGRVLLPARANVTTK